MQLPQDGQTAIHRRLVILTQFIALEVMTDLPAWHFVTMLVMHIANVVRYASMGFANTHEFESHPIMNLVVLQSDVVLVHGVPAPNARQLSEKPADNMAACWLS